MAARLPGEQGDRADQGDDLAVDGGERWSEPTHRSLDDPDRATAALTTSALATMMTMSSLKPLKASLGLTIPTATATSRASTATWS